MTEILPSKRIEALARKRLDAEKAKGAVLFREGSHLEAVVEAIIDYLDEVWGRDNEKRAAEIVRLAKQDTPTNLLK